MVTLNTTVPQNNFSSAEGGELLTSFSALTSIEESNNQIFGSNSSEILTGTSGDDEIFALDGDDTIIGTTGNDLLDGGDGFDTVDFGNFGEAVTILPAGAFDNSGQTQLNSIEKIIGATGRANTIDGSTSTGNVTSLDVDLGNNTFTVRDIPGIGSLNFEVENFVNVVGTAAKDRIIGNSLDNNLSGGNGNDEITGAGSNDTLVGGSGNDRLNGTDALLRGAGEQDILTGGNGRDRFILGDRNGSFYLDEGDNDFAEIVDFSFGDIIEFGRGGIYSFESDRFGSELFVQSEGEKELVAKIQLSFSNRAQANFIMSNTIASENG